MTRQNILITGASSGIGRGMAIEFAKMRRNLALCARRLERLEELKEQIGRDYPDVRVVLRQLDVDDHDQVFEVFRECDAALGGIDRVIVNAGIGKGASLGKGYFHANKQTAITNFVSAIAQCEAALELFRAKNDGHLVTISSVSAVRGLSRGFNVYAATKAGLSSLSEGMRVDLLGKPIRVTTIHPGFIRSEITERVDNVPFMVDTEVGCRAIVAAIEKERAQAFVPRWPWTIYRHLMPIMPRSIVRKMS